jgi:hypothetical protein
MSRSHRVNPVAEARDLVNRLEAILNDRERFPREHDSYAFKTGYLIGTLQRLLENSSEAWEVMLRDVEWAESNRPPV